MDYSKLLVDGRWVNRGSPDEPKWELMAYPIVNFFDTESGYTGSFVMVDEANLPNRCSQSSIDKLLSSESRRDVTFHNFGEYTDNEGESWQLLLTTTIPYIKDNALSAQVKEGYVFLDDIKPKDTNDDLDMWIYESLKSLTGPHTIHFTKEA